MSALNKTTDLLPVSAAPSPDDGLAQALQAIQQHIAEQEQMIQQMKDDINQIEKDKDQIKNAYHHHTRWYMMPMGGCYWTTYTTCDRGLVNRLNNDISAREGEIKDIQSKLETIGFADLDKAINKLIEGWDQARDNVKEYVRGSESRFKEDVQQINGFLNSIFQAMMIRVQLNADLAMSQLEDDGSGKIDLQKIVMDSISQMLAFNGVLSGIESNADRLFDNYGTDAEKAEAHKHGIAWWEKAFGNGYAKKAQDNDIIDNAHFMQTLMTGLESALAPSLASMSTDLMQVAFSINQILKKLLSILNDKSLSPEEKHEKLKSTALQLMALAFGLISLVYSVSQKEKGKSEAKMSEANGQAARLNMISMQEKQKIMEELKRIAHITQIVMKVAEFTIGMAMAIATGGVAGVLMASFTVADAAFDMTDKLADACGGGIGGAAAAAAIETVITCGVATALEGAEKASMEAAVATITQTIKTVLKTMLKEMVERVVVQAAKTAVDASEQAIAAGIKIVEKNALEAAELAAKKVFDQVFRENGMSLIFRMVQKGLFTDGLKALEELAKPAMEQAAREAAEQSIQKTAEVMKTLGKVSDFSNEELKLFEESVKNAANEAVAQVRNISPEKANKISSEKSVAKAAVKGAGIGALYGFAQTHMSTQIAKKAGNEDETLQMILGIIDQVLLMVTSLLSGNFDYSRGNLMNLMLRGARGVQAAGMGAEVYSNEQRWETEMRQADVTTSIGMLQSSLDMANNMIQPSINQRQKDSAQQNSKEAEMQFESTAQMAASLWSYSNKAAQALLA